MNRTTSLPPAAACPSRTAADSRTTRIRRAVGKQKALLARWHAARRRRRAEAQAWREARTFEDVAVLTAHWLRGHLLWNPNGHAGGPDPETSPLAEILAAANEAGILTEGSQPGELAEHHGLPWRQRAFVTGFVADAALAQALCAQAAEAGLIVRAYRPGSRVDENGERDAVDVTRWGARVNTGMGNRASRRAVRRIFLGCHPQAVRAVTGAWQITVIDPEWGRDTVLWPLLRLANSSTAPLRDPRDQPVDVTPELLDHARTEADRLAGCLRLSTLQRRLRVPHAVAIALAERLGEEGRMDPAWRAQALEDALRSYSLAALAHEHMTAGRPIEEDWPPSDIQEALASGLRHARLLGATAEDFDRARRTLHAERGADLAEIENEARAQDAVRQDLLAEVADLYGVDPGSAPDPGPRTTDRPETANGRSEQHGHLDEPPW